MPKPFAAIVINSARVDTCLLLTTHALEKQRVHPALNFSACRITLRPDALKTPARRTVCGGSQFSTRAEAAASACPILAMRNAMDAADTACWRRKGAAACTAGYNQLSLQLSPQSINRLRIEIQDGGRGTFAPTPLPAPCKRARRAWLSI